jgi:large subunit ribosomal protein L20
MTRARSGVTKNNRRKKLLKLAKGYYGRAKNCLRVAVEKIEKALRYAYRDRRTRKRDMRALWIQRINAAARSHGIVYSQLINGMKKANIIIDRKVLSDIAITEPKAFEAVVQAAKKALAA